MKTKIVKKEEDSLENFYINRFGKDLYEMFFEKYTDISESLFKILKNEYSNYKRVTNYNISKLELDFALTEEFSELKVDYEKIYNEFDGMEIYHFDYRLVHCIFNTWDCDSICIWHKDCVYLLDGGKV